ncbi:transposase family protein [Phycicoccus sp. SLBN-51]|uniref:transposase family protein n=1 Tax=Phycicoccus sp. SLBN-51 TaxID=2768447 RepID=UPI0011525BC3|nr:transposase family protein [Phycicoccus sp. SLBN-51]TQJ49275.1 hypothetical protein FBY26_0953 [Phycicoccus sp. SLBN-51]
MTHHGSVAGTARVLDLTAARTRQAGERTIERRSDGHRLGNHGNRASELMKKAVITQLRDIAAIRGDVTADDLREAAARADVTYRQVCRWWRADLPNQLHQLDDQGHHAGHHTHADGDQARVDLPRFLYRFAEPGKFQFTPDEIEVIARSRCAKDGFAALAQRPGSRVKHVSRSTLYAAWDNVSPAVRAGAKYGDKTQRASEATYPLTGRDQVNESWSIDEYDLKVTADYNGIRVEPKVLIVRERRSGAPLAYTLLPRAGTGTDTGVVLAAAAIGFTCPHPRDSQRQLRVAGVPRLLVSDQGGPFIGDDGAAAARRLGIGPNPIASHRPQSNGDHEVMHQSLLRHFVDGPGSRRGWTDRAGTNLDHGVIPWQTVVEEMAHWWTTILGTPYTSGDRKGRTRLEVYADEVDDANVYQGPTLTPADEAALAVPVAERSYDKTRGVHYEGRYWLSPELAAAAKDHERITLKQLLDPDVLYAFDRKDRFIGIVLDRAAADLEHVHDLHQDRVQRQQFVEGSIAEPKAAAARAAATDAADAWAEAAEGLATAAEELARELTDTDAAAAELPSAPEAVADSGRTHAEPVRPTNRRRRKAPADKELGTVAGPVAGAATDIDDDDDAAAVAEFFRRNATRSLATQGREGDQEQDQEDDEEQHHEHDDEQDEEHDQHTDEQHDEERTGDDDAR